MNVSYDQRIPPISNAISMCHEAISCSMHMLPIIICQWL